MRSLNLASSHWIWLWLTWYIHVWYGVDCVDSITIQFCHRHVQTIFVLHGSINPRNHTACIHWNTAVETIAHCLRFRCKLVDLASVTIKQASTTTKHAQNQPPSYHHWSVYHFDSTKYRGKKSFQSLVLMIQNSLNGAPFSFLCGSKTTVLNLVFALLTPVHKANFIYTCLLGR